MKKIASVILSALIVISMFTFMATASDGITLTVKADKTEVEVGDIVNVTVSTTENSELCSFTLNLVYDSDLFEVVEGSAVATEDVLDGAMVIFNEKADEGVRMVYTTQGHLADNVGDLFTVQLKAIKAGITELDIITGDDFNIAVGDKDEQPVTPAVEPVEIVIKEKAPTHVCEYEVIVTKEATCTEDGAQELTCKGCGEKKTEVIEATGHAYGEPTIITPATCLLPGLQSVTCANCGDTKNEVVPTLEHVYGNSTVTKEPTCSEKGEEKAWCINCNMPKTTEIATLPHTPGEWETVKEPTDTEEGEKVKKCTECGAELVKEAIPIYVLGDVDGDGQIKAVDARMALQDVAGIIKLEGRALKAADIDGDGNVEAFEARMILQAVVGLRVFQ